MKYKSHSLIHVKSNLGDSIRADCVAPYMDMYDSKSSEIKCYYTIVGNVLVFLVILSRECDIVLIL